MNITELLQASATFSTKEDTLEPLILHVTSRAEKTQKSQLAFILKYATQAPSTIIDSILAGFLSICEPHLAYSAIPHIKSSLAMKVAVTKSLQNNFKPPVQHVVDTLLDDPKTTDIILQEILQLETQKALETEQQPPYCLSQEIANSTLLLLQQHPKLLLNCYFFIPLLVQTSAQAGQNLLKQLAISHQTVDYSKLFLHLLDANVNFDSELILEAVQLNFKNPVLLAKLAVLNNMTADIAGFLISKMQENSNFVIKNYIMAFKILIKYDFSTNEKLCMQLMNLSKFITIFYHFYVIVQDMASKVKADQEGYHFLNQFVKTMLNSAKVTNLGQITQICSKTAENFSLYENLIVFGTGVDIIQYICFSNKTRFEEFATCFNNWLEESQQERYQQQINNINNSLQLLVNVLKNIEIEDFIEENLMIYLDLARKIYEQLNDNTKLKFLTLINSNVTDNLVYNNFRQILVSSNLQEIIVSTTQHNIENTSTFISSLSKETEIKSSVSYLVQKTANLPSLPKELQQIVVTLLSSFIVNFPTCLGEKTEQIFAVLINQMLKHSFDQNCCYKLINAFYKVNKEACLQIFQQSNLGIKYRIRFISENLINFEDYKQEIMESLDNQNSKCRSAGIDIIFKLAENGISYQSFLAEQITVSSIKFMTYYGFRIGEILNSQLDQYLLNNQLPTFPEEFLSFGYQLLQNYSTFKQPTLNYIEMLFNNLSQQQLFPFITQISYQIYELSLIPKYRTQIKRIFIAAGLCIGRDSVNEILTKNLALLSQSLGSFEATQPNRSLQMKIMHVLRKISPQSYPGRYEANFYIQLGLTVPTKLRSQLNNRNYIDEEIQIGRGDQAQIDEILAVKEDEFEDNENIDQFMEQVENKHNQDRILENVKEELKMIEQRRMQQHLSNINTGLQFKAKGAGGDLQKNGKRPTASIPLHGKLSKQQRQGVNQVISGVFKRDKVGSTKLARAVQEKIKNGAKANSIKAGKVQGGRKKIQAAMKHAKK